MRFLGLFMVFFLPLVAGEEEKEALQTSIYIWSEEFEDSLVNSNKYLPGIKVEEENDDTRKASPAITKCQRYTQTAQKTLTSFCWFSAASLYIAGIVSFFQTDTVSGEDPYYLTRKFFEGTFLFAILGWFSWAFQEK